jgi:chloramphenicol-sensitive protein RarD
VGTDQNARPATATRAGILYGLAAYGFWGVMPLYFAAVQDVPPGEILAQRIFWCGVLLAVVLGVTGRWREMVDRLRTPGVPKTFVFTAVFLTVNWLAYIYGVTHGQTVETSLGYFINPLLSVLLGMVVLRERLRFWQAVAVLLAAAGVLIPVAAARDVPKIALTVAVSFALYGLLRKRAPVDALVGLSIETFILAPFAAGYLVILLLQGRMSLGHSGWVIDGLLLASGVITAAPLLWFGKAARMLSLSTLGILQYVAPTMQFLLAVLHLGETVAPAKWAAFVLIWAALVIYSFDSWRYARSRQAVVIADGDGGAELEPVDAG